MVVCDSKNKDIIIKLKKKEDKIMIDFLNIFQGQVFFCLSME